MTDVRSALKDKRVSLILILSTLLLLRRRILRRTKDLVSKSKLSAEELAAAAQQLYVENADGSKTLLIPFRGRIAKVRIFNLA